MRFRSPPAHEARKVDHFFPGLPHPVGAAFRVSHPLDGLFPSWPSGLVSCRWHSWGSPLQSFSLRTKPYCLSTAAPLLPFTLRRDRRRTRRPVGRSMDRSSNHRDTAGATRRRDAAPGCSTSPKSDTWSGGLDPNQAAALLGFLPLQGLAPTRSFAPVTGLLPPMDFGSEAFPSPRGAGGWPPGWSSGVSIDRLAAARTLVHPATLLRFANLISLLASSG
jgi:hypothetical protein